jgi:hypothetical protein
VADILDLVPRFIDLLAAEPTLEAIFAVAGPGERFDFSSGNQIELATADAVFSVWVDEDPDEGITSVSIDNMSSPPSLAAIVARYWPGSRSVQSAPGQCGFHWRGLRHLDDGRQVSLVAGTFVDDVVSLMVQR